MKKILLLIILIYSFNSNAQTITIPDAQFEQALIRSGIDTDGIINQQISTNDALAVRNLNLGPGPGYLIFDPFLTLNLSGLENFVNIEYLNLTVRRLQNGVNLNGLVNLKMLLLNNTLLNDIDLSTNVSLEYLEIGNIPDALSFTQIENINLSNSPNVNLLSCEGLYTLREINLNNNNNVNIPNMRINLNTVLGDTFPNVCIQIDNINAALNNLPPYNSWTINGNYFYSENCALSTEKFINENIKIFPNPAKDFVNITNGNSQIVIESVQILDGTGKWIKKVEKDLDVIDLSHFASGKYLFIIQTNKGNVVKNVLVK